jgi:cyclopropane fatty-acyl-phospholipid synthase-like methyltransferase
MNWDKEYLEKAYIWGDKPSELANIVLEYIKLNMTDKPLNILDIGCGYGRDSIFLSSNINYDIKGIDISKNAIAIAKELSINIANVSFSCESYAKTSNIYDIILVANLYHLLTKEERKIFRDSISRLMRSDSVMFINTLSVNDKEEYRKGNPVESEQNSFIHDKFMHFSTKKELLCDFSGFKIIDIFEKEYVELRKGGDHLHTSFFLVACLN